jgi:HK97 family phage major capsid protein
VRRRAKRGILTPAPAEPRNDVIPLKSIEIKNIEITEEVTTEDPVKVVETDAITETVTAIETEVKAMEDPKVETPEVKAAEVNAPAVETPLKRTAPKLNLKTKLGDDANKAFNHYLKTGDPSGIRTGEAWDEAIKTDYELLEGSQYYGQEVVPTEIAAKIYELREALSFARAAGANVLNVSTATVWLPKEGEKVDALDSVSEGGTFEVSTSKPLDKTIVTVANYTNSIKASNQVLEDSVVDLTSFLNYRFAKMLALSENAAALTAIAAGGTLGVTAASHTTITGAEVVKLYYALQAEYRDNVSWLMTQKTEGVIRGLTGNWFQFVPNTIGGNPTTGQPTGFMVDPRSKVFNYSGVDELDAGAAKTVYAFNAPASLVICQRKGLTIQRDPYTLMLSGSVQFAVNSRFGIGVVNADAIQWMVHPTA